MPYQKVTDLPKEVLDKYKNPKQRRAFMGAFNSQYESCMSDGGEKDKCEERAFATAHTAAQGVKKTMRDQPKMAALMLRKSRPLVAARNFLQRQYPEGEWTSDDQFHMTMVTLLDDAYHAKLPRLEAAPLDIKITSLSLWETTSDDYAVVFDIEPSPEMEALQKSLYDFYDGHERSGFSDPENWIPHVTLGYLPSSPEIMPNMDFDPFVITGKRVELMQQKTTISSRALRGKREEKLFIDNQGDLEIGAYKYTQQEAGYDPLGGDDVEACANCRWFVGNSCIIVDGYISPTGYSNQYVPVEVMPDEYSAPDVGWMSKFLHAMGLRDKKAILDGPSGFKVIQDGKRWIGWYTNAYKDRDEEGFPTAAIQRDINRMWGSNEFPELWFYHVPGTKHGQADWVGMIGRFVVATGTFDDTEMAKALVKSYSHETMSHGFVYNPDKKLDGWYWDYATFEISPTPIGAEANPLTRFEVKDMSLSEKQIAELRERLGPLADPLIAAGKSATAEADAAGIAFKASEATDGQDPEDEKPEDENMKASLQALQATVGQLADVVTQLALRPEPAAKSEGSAPKSALSEDMQKSILAHYEAVMAAEEQNKSFNEMSLGEQVVAVLQRGG